MSDGLVKRPELKYVLGTILFTVVVPGSIAVLVPYLLLNMRLHLIPMRLGNYHFLGLLPLLLGIISYFWSAWDLTFVGKGTPSPIAPPQVLVVTGLYRYVRNPMYLGILLVLVGEALYFQEFILLVYAGLFTLSFNRLVVNNEEHKLRRKFGANYNLYCHAIPRWFPKIKIGKLMISGG